MSTKTIEFSIARFDPDKETQMRMQHYSLEVPAERDVMLLQALIWLKERHDESLAFRRSCGEGVCGSDGMNINGKNGLACTTPLSSLKTPIVLKPLPGLPIVRDLIVDMEPFFRQYERVEPWLQNDKEPPAKERLQSPAERNQLDSLYECILCACCTTSCPSFWWNGDDNNRFAGPAALLALERFLVDSRDEATDKRLANLGHPDTVFACRTIMNCTHACPKDLNPAKAIGDIRRQMLSGVKKSHKCDR